jgi:hypothetical protein
MILQKAEPHAHPSKNDKTSEYYPSRRKVYPTLEEVMDIGKGPVRKVMLLLLLMFVGAVGIAYAQSANERTALNAYKQLFEESNVGNLHVYSLDGSTDSPEDYFYGERIPRGLYGLFAANWRDELPDDFEAYALFKIKHGAGDAYLMRFAGLGTQNLIGLFSIEGEKVTFLKILSSHSCSDSTCWQTDSWIQDFDGDTRLDILQKVRVLQFTLMNAPVEEYSQVLRQDKNGRFVVTKELDLDVADYKFVEEFNTINQ